MHLLLIYILATRNFEIAYMIHIVFLLYSASLAVFKIIWQKYKSSINPITQEKLTFLSIILLDLFCVNFFCTNSWIMYICVYSQQTHLISTDMNFFIDNVSCQWVYHFQWYLWIFTNLQGWTASLLLKLGILLSKIKVTWIQALEYCIVDLITKIAI